MQRTSVSKPGGELQRTAGISKYVQFASLLRANILRGRWKIGDKLPTVAELAAEHALAMVTVRQALRLLVDEGLIASQQGRGTLVIGLPEPPSDSLRSAINNPNASEKTFKIQLLEKRTGLDLPNDFVANGNPLGPYVLLRKMHLHDGVPFCVMELYVAEDIFERFASGSEHHRKINGLLFEVMPDQMGNAHNVITVETADYELGAQLRCAFGAPVAKILRSLSDNSGRIVYAGIFWYRGDRFVLDFTMPARSERAPEPKSSS